MDPEGLPSSSTQLHGTTSVHAGLLSCHCGTIVPNNVFSTRRQLQPIEFSTAAFSIQATACHRRTALRQDRDAGATRARGDRKSDRDASSGRTALGAFFNLSGQRHAEALTSTFLAAAFASGFLGSVIVSTPLAKSAEILSTSTPSGSTKLRLNEPYSRSDR